MTTQPKLTPARRRALEVLVSNRRALSSNVTDPDRRLVYWQSYDWLIDVGYAELDGTARHSARATTAGIARAEAEGITR